VDLLREFHGPNAAYILELYEKYLADPNSVDAETRAGFARWTPPMDGPSPPQAPAAVAADVG
ncbi:uncharacterized protein METZ01_LOCUS441572, partial [marine metagenome]